MEFLDGYKDILSCTKPLEVKKIRIAGYELDPVLRTIKRFQNLEHFECSWGGSWSHIPESILKLPQLKYLSFQRNYLTEIPLEIIYAEKLEVLDLSHNNILTIPQELTNLKYLKELNLDKNPIEKIEEGLSEMMALEDLNIAKATFSKYPESLLKLIPKLKCFVVSRKLTTLLEKKYPEISSQIPYFYQWTSLEKKHLKTLKQLFDKSNYSIDFQVFVCNLLAGNKQKILEQSETQKLLKATNLKRMEPIRLRALEYLGQQLHEKAQKTLIKNARVCVQGKLGINKKELRKKLKDHNIGYTAKLDDKTTHYLLGQLPGEDVYIAQENKIHLITEKNIMDYWESVENPYLIETATKAPEQLEAMAAMLTSNQPESIAVALEMFKQGGFPKSLMTELFIAYKCLIDQPAIQREAERLLRQYGDADLVAKLNMENALFSYVLGENRTTSYLNKYAKNTALDSIKMAKVIYRLFGNAQIYLIRHLPKDQALDFIESELMNNAVLDLSKRNLKAIPPIVYKLGSKLKKLSLRDNSFDKINEKIKLFTALEELDLRYNYALKRTNANSKEILTMLPRNCKLLI